MFFAGYYDQSFNFCEKAAFDQISEEFAEPVTQLKEELSLPMIGLHIDKEVQT